MMRKAGSEAFFALKKVKLYESKTEGSLTTLSLFGDTYRFFFDSERKIAWMKSQHHYQKSSNFKLSTRHKEWEGVFSYPRMLAYTLMNANLLKEGIVVTGATDNRTLGTECKIITNQAYRGDKRKLSRIFGGILWKHYDHEIASLAMKVYGLSSSAIDYSIIANNKEEFLDTLQKAPAVLPVWRDLVVLKMYQSRKPLAPSPPPEQPPADDEDEFLALLGAAVPRNQRMPALYENLREEAGNIEHPGYIASSFNFPEEATTFTFPDIIKTVKIHLESRGLKSAGWRYLLRLSPRIVQMIINHTGGRDFVHLLNWLAVIGVVPRQSLIKPFLRNIAFNADRTEDLTAVLRTGFAHAQKMRRGVKTFFDGQMHMVLDWFQSAGEAHPPQMYKGFVPDPQVFTNPRRECRHVRLDSNQRKAPWDWFMRQQITWHQDVAAREAARTAEEAARLKEKHQNEAWESAITDEIIIKKKYKVIPLTSTHALIEEGKDMHHCVGSYSYNCMDGYSRIFAIRGLDGSRVATLELRNRTVVLGEGLREGIKNPWEVNQCRGVCNETVSDEVKAVAQEVAKRYNKALGTNFAQEKEAIAV